MLSLVVVLVCLAGLLVIMLLSLPFVLLYNAASYLKDKFFNSESKKVN